MPSRIIRPALTAVILCLTGAWASQPLPPVSDPLRVVVHCSGTRCDAYAFGGSESYVGFDWNGGYEENDFGSMSTVDWRWDCEPGYFHAVYATVTDSNGATASGNGLVFCPTNPGWH